MLNKLLTYSTFGNLFCGVEHTSKNGLETIYGLVLKQQKNEFSVAGEFNVQTISELKNRLESKQHVFVTINTEKVLFRMLEGELEEQRALPQAFPNIKIEDFYYEFHTSNDKTFIAICRKNVIESILKEYASHQYNILGFSLGNLGISQLEGVIEANTIQTSNGIVDFINSSISEISITTNELNNYSINGLRIRNLSVLSLAGILTYYTNSFSTNTNFIDHMMELKNNFKHKRIFNVGLRVGLGILFISLLTSFMLFTHYATKIEEEASSLAINKSQKTTFLKLVDEAAKKEKLLNDFSLTSSRSSWHLDQLGQTIPNSIILTEMQWQPLVRAIKKELQIEIQERTILIKGIAHKAADFSKWIDLLEEQKWIEKVAINTYGNGNKRVPVFEIEIIFTQ